MSRWSSATRAGPRTRCATSSRSHDATAGTCAASTRRPGRPPRREQRSEVKDSTRSDGGDRRAAARRARRPGLRGGEREGRRQEPRRPAEDVGDVNLRRDLRNHGVRLRRTAPGRPSRCVRRPRARARDVRLRAQRSRTSRRRAGEGDPPLSAVQGSPPSMEIRSFRVVFALERRIHHIDHWRIPVPYGLPVRALAYAVAALAVIVIAGRLPLVGDVVGLVPAPLRLVVWPGAAGFALSRLRVDGRPAHAFLLAMARYRAGPRYLSAFRAAPRPGTRLRVGDPLAFMPDERGAQVRRGRVRGPVRIRLAYPMAAEQRGGRL